MNARGKYGKHRLDGTEDKRAGKQVSSFEAGDCCLATEGMSHGRYLKYVNEGDEENS